MERKSCYSVESTLERGSSAATSSLYVGGSKSLENLIREAKVGLVGTGREEKEARQSEEIYMDMRGSCVPPPASDQLLRAEV